MILETKCSDTRENRHHKELDKVSSEWLLICQSMLIKHKSNRQVQTNCKPKLIGKQTIDKFYVFVFCNVWLASIISQMAYHW